MQFLCLSITPLTEYRQANYKAKGTKSEFKWGNEVGWEEEEVRDSLVVAIHSFSKRLLMFFPFPFLVSPQMHQSLWVAFVPLSYHVWEPNEEATWPRYQKKKNTHKRKNGQARKYYCSFFLMALMGVLTVTDNVPSLSLTHFVGEHKSNMLVLVVLQYHLRCLSVHLSVHPLSDLFLITY